MKEDNIYNAKSDEKEKKELEKTNKYAKFIGLNNYKNKTNLIINKMMINGFRKSKIYEIIIN